jgi:hypothetical protein
MLRWARKTNATLSRRSPGYIRLRIYVTPNLPPKMNSKRLNFLKSSPTSLRSTTYFPLIRPFVDSPQSFLTGIKRTPVNVCQNSLAWPDVGYLAREWAFDYWSILPLSSPLTWHISLRRWSKRITACIKDSFSPDLSLHLLCASYSKHSLDFSVHRRVLWCGPNKIVCGPLAHFWLLGLQSLARDDLKYRRYGYKCSTSPRTECQIF